MHLFIKVLYENLNKFKSLVQSINIDMKFTDLHRMTIAESLCDINGIWGDFTMLKETAITSVQGMEELEKILNAGQNIDEQQANGNTALIIACMTGHDNIVQYLLERGANPNIANTAGNTALIMAVKLHFKNIVKMLLEHGANPNMRRKDGFTALMLAAMDNQLDMASELVKHGADVSLKNNEGMTAMDMAAMYDTHEILKLLKGGK